jgi:hypothetical protein
MGKHSRTSYRGNSTKLNRNTGGNIGTAYNVKGAQKKRAFGGDGGEQEPLPRLQLLDATGEVILGTHTLNWPLAPEGANGETWTNPVPFNEDNFGWKIYDTNNKIYLDNNNYTVVTFNVNATHATVGGFSIPTEKTIYYYLFNLDDAPSGDGDITEEEKSLALDTAERVLKYKDFYAPVVTWEDTTTPIQYEKHKSISRANINTVFTYGDEFWAQADLKATVKLTHGIANVPINGANTDAKIKEYIATAGIGEYTYTVTVKDIYGYANQLNMETVLTKIIKVVDTTKPVIEVTMEDQDIEVGSSDDINYGKVTVTDGTLSTAVDAELGATKVKWFNTILLMGTLTVALTKAGVAVDSIDTSTVGVVYEVKFDFTDGKNDAVPITRTITIIAEAPEPSDYSLLVGGKSEDDADMLIVYDGDDGSIKVTKAPFLTDGAQYHLNGLSFVLPLEDLADGVTSGSTEDTSAQNAFAKFDNLINYRDSKSKGAKFTNISTGESPANFGAGRGVITQKYQFPIIPKREGGAIMEKNADGTENWTGDKLDVNNITAGKTKREMHLVLAQQIGGLALTKSNIDNNYTLGDTLWKHTSQLALENADNGTNGPKTLTIDAAQMPVTRPGYPYVIDTAYYAKSGNEQPASEDIGKPWKPSRKELLKFFGWQEAAINAVAGDVQNFSLDAWQWMADTDTSVPGVDMVQNGRSKELRGHIRMGSVKPSNGAKFAVENNAVVGIDIAGGHIIEKKEKDDQALTLQEQGVAAALLGEEATKFYSAIGRIEPESTLFLPTGNTAGTDTAIFYNVAFKFKNIFL